MWAKNGHLSEESGHCLQKVVLFGRKWSTFGKKWSLSAKNSHFRKISGKTWAKFGHSTPAIANCSQTSVSQSTPLIKGNKFNVWLSRHSHRWRRRCCAEALPAHSRQNCSMRWRRGRVWALVLEPRRVRPRRMGSWSPSSSAGEGEESMLLRNLLLLRESWKVLVRWTGRKHRIYFGLNI